MIMKTVKKGTDKIEHVEYGDNVIYFYSSKDRNGFTRTEKISRRIAGCIMKNFTDEEYNNLLDAVISTARDAPGRKSSSHGKTKHSCEACTKNGSCKSVQACNTQA